MDSAVAADRNLLFGVLALQLNFITRDQLGAALNAWVLDKNQPLEDILDEQGAVSADQRLLLQALVAAHLKQHHDDPKQSLAALSSVGSALQDLEKIADPDIEASLRSITVSWQRATQPLASITTAAGTPNATGLRFRILRPHARGGLGQVYVAHDQELSREVALKEIQDKHADDPESRSRFLLEAEITGGLEHPGIVPVYGLGQYADGRPFYAMRFIKGDSLKDAIERFHRADGPEREPGARMLELRKLLGRFIDVCEAMQYAHDRGILHRDLKPGNIMLGKYGETLIVDWGLAKTLDRPDLPAGEPALKPASASGTAETLPGSAVGTPQYMSPEQAEGRLDAMSPASDVYSLGATLFALLTGRASVEDSALPGQKKADLAKLLNKVATGRLPRPSQVKPGVDPALEAICLKAMALRPADRYAAPRVLASDIEHWLADEPVSAWAEPWSVQARRWVGKHRTLVAGGAAALLVGMVSLLVSTILLANANRAIERASQEKEGQRLLAIANEAHAVAAQKKSEERLDQTVAALKLFAIDARTYCEDALVPGESKGKLYSLLVDQLEKVADRPDQEFNEDKARSAIFMHQTVALTAIELGRTRLAQESLAKALKLADAWRSARPADPVPRSYRAAVLHFLGIAQQRVLDHVKAGEYLNEALELRKQLVDNDKVERFTPAKTRIDYADSLDALERWDEAIAMRRQALERVRENIGKTKGTPDDAHFALEGLNWTYLKAALKTNVYAKKKEYLEQADATAGELMRLRPHGRLVLDRWASIVRELGELERRQGERAEEAKQADQAKQHFTAAQQRFTKLVALRRQLAIADDLLKQRQAYATSWYDLARIQQKLGQDKLARDHFEYCLHVRDEILIDYPLRQTPQLRLDRLFPMVALGRHAEVALEADRMEVKYPDKTTTYRLARLYALCSSAPEVKDKTLQETYRTKAIACLLRSIQAGNNDWFGIRFDADFAPLRQDPRLEKILKSQKE